MYSLYTLAFDLPRSLVSRHRTLAAAIRADAKLQREHRKIFGGNGYTPTAIFDADMDRVEVSYDEAEAATRGNI